MASFGALWVLKSHVSGGCIPHAPGSATTSPVLRLEFRLTTVQTVHSYFAVRYCNHNHNPETSLIKIFYISPSDCHNHNDHQRCQWRHYISRHLERIPVRERDAGTSRTNEDAEAMSPGISVISLKCDNTLRRHRTASNLVIPDFHCHTPPSASRRPALNSGHPVMNRISQALTGLLRLLSDCRCQLLTTSTCNTSVALCSTVIAMHAHRHFNSHFPDLYG